MLPLANSGMPGTICQPKNYNNIPSPQPKDGAKTTLEHFYILNGQKM